MAETHLIFMTFGILVVEIGSIYRLLMGYLSASSIVTESSALCFSLAGGTFDVVMSLKL